MWTTGSWPTPIDWKIYRSESLWLISIKNWNNWLTIADKNCWATEAYDWGEITLANRWNFYQRWNNYWFSSITPTTLNEQVDATNYGPYYESDTFITSSDWWETSRNTNLWGADTDRIESKQWPSPEWYYVPKRQDFQNLTNAILALWLDRDSEVVSKIYLKIPNWQYRTCNRYWQNSARDISFPWFDLVANNNAAWMRIRCFKIISEIPDSSWTVLHQWTWNAWIFWSAEKWVISISSDWENRITIMDKNLWATVVYSYWDELSESNCWYQYQWWNNYGFPYDWPTKTSPVKVNAANYGPYYYWDKFIIWFNNWSSVANYNLWWEVTRTKKAMRWPCAEWFHIPRSNEASSFVDLVHSLGISKEWFKTYLKMPLIWYIDGTWWYYDNMWVYRTCSHTNASLANALLLNYWDEWVMWSSYSKGNLIRPFKNESVVPDSTWTKLY